MFTSKRKVKSLSNPTQNVPKGKRTPLSINIYKIPEKLIGTSNESNDSLLFSNVPHAAMPFSLSLSTKKFGTRQNSVVGSSKFGEAYPTT